MKKILIASDSFKGTLSSIEIGNAFKRHYANTKIISISDGGEGFVDSLLFNNGQFKLIKLKTVDDLGKEITINLAISDDVAYLDVASIVALNNYPLKYHLKKTTKGLGLIIKQIERMSNIKKVYIGLGGSSTSDIGFYASLEIGFKYMSSDGYEINKLEEVENATYVIRPTLTKEYIGLSDVNTTLLGPTGALSTFGKQKGYTESEAHKYESFFLKVASLIDFEKKDVKGAGAAGGLGYFVAAFLGGKIEKGVSVLLHNSSFAKLVDESDLIITGEGSFDDQSFLGKVPCEIAKKAKLKSVILVAGSIAASQKKLETLFLDWFELKKKTQNLDEAIKKTRTNLDDVILKIKEKYLKN